MKNLFYITIAAFLMTLSPALARDFGDSTFLGWISSEGGLKDSDVTTPIALGDGSNTFFNTTNKTIVGSVNEVYGLIPGTYWDRTGTVLTTNTAGDTLQFAPDQIFNLDSGTGDVWLGLISGTNTLEFKNVNGNTTVEADNILTLTAGGNWVATAGSAASASITTEAIPSGSSNSGGVTLATGGVADGTSGNIFLTAGLPTGSGYRGEVRMPSDQKLNLDGGSGDVFIQYASGANDLELKNLAGSVVLEGDVAFDLIAGGSSTISTNTHSSPISISTAAGSLANPSGAISSTTGGSVNAAAGNILQNPGTASGTGTHGVVTTTVSNYENRILNDGDFLTKGWYDAQERATLKALNETIAGGTSTAAAIFYDMNETTIDNMDATTGWTPSNSVIALETTIKIEGTGSVQMQKTSTSGNYASMDKTMGSSKDFSSDAATFVLWVYIKDATMFNKIASGGGGIQIRYGSDASNYYDWRFNRDNIYAVGWNRIGDMRKNNAYNTIGTPNQTKMDYVRYYHFTTAQSSTWTGDAFLVDYEYMTDAEWTDTTSTDPWPNGIYAGSGSVIVDGLAEIFTGLTPGSMYYINPADGLLTTTASQFRFGKAISTTAMYVDIDVQNGHEIRNIDTVTTNYTLLNSDFTTLVNSTGGNIDIDLPANPLEGQMYNVKKISSDSYIVTLDGNGNNIDGVATKTTTTQWQGWTVHFDGTDWFIL